MIRSSLFILTQIATLVHHLNLQRMRTLTAILVLAFTLPLQAQEVDSLQLQIQAIESSLKYEAE